MKAKRPREEILRLLVKIMRATAVRNKMVGQELLSVCIPKVSADNKEFFLTTGGPESDSSTFQVWPAHHSEPKQHGPAAVFGGGSVLTGLQVGILGPPTQDTLGGLVVIDGQPKTLKYPCCVLFNDLTNCYMSARLENSSLDYLAVFTNEQAIEENLRRSSDRLVRVFLRSATELEKLLNSVRGADMVILNPNSPVSGITFSNSIVHLLQALKNSTT
jgi:hypothetical protein